MRPCVIDGLTLLQQFDRTIDMFRLRRLRHGSSGPKEQAGARRYAYQRSVEVLFHSFLNLLSIDCLSLGARRRNCRVVEVTIGERNEYRPVRRWSVPSAML